MGKTRGPYKEEFPVGSTVRIASRSSLDEFLKTWRLHNKLQPAQLDYAGQIAEVESIGFYHGGDELYKLKGVPGIWHGQCLAAHDNSRPEKKAFLVGYDYGTGGCWAVINSRSAEEITQKYPRVVVVTERPKWMTGEFYERLLKLEIDDPPTGWLAVLVSGGT